MQLQLYFHIEGYSLEEKKLTGASIAPEIIKSFKELNLNLKSETQITQVKNVRAMQYKSTIRFKKLRGNNTLVPEIVHDALKNEKVTEIDLFREDKWFQTDLILELREE